MIHRFLKIKISHWLYIGIASFAFVLFLQHTPAHAYTTDSANQIVTKQIRSASCEDIVGSEKTVLAAVTKIPAGSTLKRAGVSSSSLGTNSDGQPIGNGTTIYAYYAGGEGPSAGFPCDVGKKVVSWGTSLTAQESSSDQDRRDSQEEAQLFVVRKALTEERQKYINRVCGATPSTTCISKFDTAVKSCASEAYNAAVAARTAGATDFGASYEKALLYCLNDKNKLGVDPSAVKDIWSKIESARNAAGERWDAENADDTTKTKCAVDGIGWIVCPVLTFLGVMNDTAFGFLNNFLEVPTRIFTDAATKSAWEAFRNLANVAFVIAFLVIIYSQITGAGISNYGLKKLLPKLIVAAILVNISFYVCAVLVDLSNIVGSSLYDLLKNIEPGTGDPGGGTGSQIWSNIMAGVLGITAGIALLALIIFAPMSLLAFAVVILILIARQAFVILLIVLSPFAFVAYLLPNTEQWFKKWWKSFSAMLLVFPIVALVFGAGSLASRILMDVAQDGGGGGGDEQMLKIVAAGVLAIPLFAVPIILKGAMSAAGSVGGKLAGLQDKATGKTKGQAGETYKNSAFARGRSARTQIKQQYRDRKYATAVAGGADPDNPTKLERLRARASRGVIGRGILPSGKFAQERVVGAAEIAADKHFDEDVKAAGLRYAGLSNDAVGKIASTGLHDGKEVTIEELAAAHDRIMSSGSFAERKDALQYAASQAGTGSKHDSATLRQHSVSGAMKRGDGNIYGVGFGNKIVDGRIKTPQQLAQEAVDNAAAGNVSAEHLVQSKGATDYLVDVSRGATILSPGSGAAVANLKMAAGEATTNASTSKDVTTEIATIFGKL